MSFFDKAKAFAKTLDTDKISEDISKGAHQAAAMLPKTGIVDTATASKIDTAAQQGAKQLDAFGDKHPEYFGKKAQTAQNPHAPVGEHGAQVDPDAPHKPQPGVPAPDNAPQAFANQEAGR